MGTILLDKRFFTDMLFKEQAATLMDNVGLPEKLAVFIMYRLYGFISNRSWVSNSFYDLRAIFIITVSFEPYFIVNKD